MKHNKNGSCLLIMIIISSIIMLYYINLWHSSSLMAESVYKKYLYEKKFRLAEALYNYGLSICINNFDSIYSKKKQNIFNIIIYNGYWLPDEKTFQAKLSAQLQENHIIKIESNLIDQEQNSTTVSSLIIKETLSTNPKNQLAKNQKTFVFKVLNWQVNED